MSDTFVRVSTTAERLKEAMKETGKKQVDLCRETGIYKGSLTNYVSGRYDPKSEAIYKLAVALDVSEMWLWGYDVPKERPQEQKNNDILADIVVCLRSDGEFFELVKDLYKLAPEKRKAFADMLKAFTE